MSVEGRELRLRKPLHHGDDRRVNESDVIASAAVAELADAPVVRAREVFDG
jgi:hypothetical protein